MNKKSLILLVFTIFLNSCATKNTETNDSPITTIPQVEVMRVNSGGLQEFSINGEVLAHKSASLTAEIRADVQNIFVKPGDKVTQGQTLITLKSDSIDSDLSTASSSLNYAQTNLYQTQDSVEKNIESAKLALEKAELTLENLLEKNQAQKDQAQESLKATKINLNLSTEAAQTALETAEKNLEKVQALNQSSETSSQVNLDNAINSSKTGIKSSLDTADELLGISEIFKHSNDDFEVNLGALDSATKEEAENQLETALALYQNMTNNYDSVYQTLKSTELTLEKTLTMLHNTSTGSYFSELQLTSYVSAVTNNLSNIRSSIASLSSAKTAYNQTLNANASNLTAAEQAVESAQKQLNSVLQESGTDKSQTVINAEAQYKTTITNLDTSEKEALKAVESAKIAYEAAKKTAELSKTGAKSSLTSISGQFEKARIMKNKLIIKAPFSGYIIDIPVELGDEVNVGTKLVNLENNDTFKIVTYLTAAQIKNISLGDEVKIGKKSKDTISAISSSIDPIIKKYKVEINHKNPFLHSGQIIPVRFTKTAINFNKNTIYLPLVAVHITASEKFVWLVDNNQITKKIIVELGEIVGSKIAILSGLSTGDRVITKGGRLFKKEGTKVKIIDTTSKNKDEQTTNQES